MRFARIGGVTALVIAACGSGDDVPTRSDVPLLLPAADEAADTLTQGLVARQRAFFAVLRSRDRTRLGDFADASFTWVREASANGAEQLEDPPPIEFVALRSGAVLDGLEHPMTQFTVKQVSGTVVVLAGNALHPSRFLTTWKLTPDGWRAVSTQDREFGSRRSAVRNPS